MSAPNLQLELSQRAQQDYSDIVLDSLLTWGEAQARRYKAYLDQALEELRHYPRIGASRSNLPSGFRVKRVEQHAIYYRIEEDTIYVSRILHARRNINAQSLP